MKIRLDLSGGARGIAHRATELGPLSSEEAPVQLADQAQRSVDDGAKALLSGKRANLAGAFMVATIMTDLKPDIPAYHEELFGPVASFYRLKDEQEAIKLANDSDFGLGGSVLTRDIARGERLANQIGTGMVLITQPGHKRTCHSAAPSAQVTAASFLSWE